MSRTKMNGFWVAVSMFAVSPVTAQAKDVPPANRVSMEQARKVALQAYAGKIHGEELEFEGGKWIYSFDLRSPKDKLEHEVNVDAITGKLIAVQTESAADEKKELQEEGGESERD